MNELETFRSEVEAFLEQSGMAPSRLGQVACNDSAFVHDLRAGRQPRFSTIERVRNFMGTQVEAKTNDRGISSARVA